MREINQGKIRKEKLRVIKFENWREISNIYFSQGDIFSEKSSFSFMMKGLNLVLKNKNECKFYRRFKF